MDLPSSLPHPRQLMAALVDAHPSNPALPAVAADLVERYEHAEALVDALPDPPLRWHSGPLPMDSDRKKFHLAATCSHLRRARRASAVTATRQQVGTRLCRSCWTTGWRDMHEDERGPLTAATATYSVMTELQSLAGVMEHLCTDTDPRVTKWLQQSEQQMAKQQKATHRPACTAILRVVAGIRQVRHVLTQAPARNLAWYAAALSTAGGRRTAKTPLHGRAPTPTLDVRILTSSSTSYELWSGKAWSALLESLARGHSLEHAVEAAIEKHPVTEPEVVRQLEMTFSVPEGARTVTFSDLRDQWRTAAADLQLAVLTEWAADTRARLHATESLALPDIDLLIKDRRVLTNVRAEMALQYLHGYVRETEEAAATEVWRVPAIVAEWLMAVCLYDAASVALHPNEHYTPETLDVATELLAVTDGNPAMPLSQALGAALALKDASPTH